MKIKAKLKSDDTTMYFRSNVYAILNKGWSKEQGWKFDYLLYIPLEGSYQLKFISNQDVHIITPTQPGEWINVDKTHFNQLVQGVNEVHSFQGYPWMIENNNFIVDVLQEKKSAIKLFYDHLSNLLEEKDDQWNYIESPKDANDFLTVFGHFHDSCLKELKYISGSYVSKDLDMSPIDDLRTVSIIFQRQFENPSTVELVFEGVIRLNLVPTQVNYTSEMLGAYLIVKDEYIYFSQFEKEMNEIEKSSLDNTWIKALCLKWRYANEYIGDETIYINKK